MSNSPHNLHLFRLIHKDNLKFILDNGMACKSYLKGEYVNIGDTTLITQRSEKSVINPPGGSFKDYVPFYFAGHLPMLYNIKTGWRGIKQINQSDLLFVVCKIVDVIATCPN